MCGVAGVLSPSARHSLHDVVTRMTAALHHRGPDDTGTWVDQDRGIALGHKRLSIVDLSPLGHQPMQSANGRYWLIYNGEIYNHQTLRKELESLAANFGAIRIRKC